MTALLYRLSGFVGRHWLRILIVGAGLFILSRKQVNFNLRLGAPEGIPAVVPTPQVEAGPPSALTDVAEAPTESGFFSQFNIFGGGDDLSHYDVLTRQEETVIEAFIRRFQNVAQAEQEKFGIPASITLASALLHSNAGTAGTAAGHQNFFALPCDEEWPGPTGRTGAGCIRAYESAWTSFRDHSLYLTSGRYAPLTQFSETDYRRWAAGLEELRFNDTDDLAQQLLRTVDKYQLFRFD